METLTIRQLTRQLGLLEQEGKYRQALQLLEKYLDSFPEEAGWLWFSKISLLCLLGRKEAAVSIFRQGLEKGLWWGESVFGDESLEALAAVPEFQRLKVISLEKFKEARAHIRRDHVLLLPEPPSSGRYPLLIALHDHHENKNFDLDSWEKARQKGWLVLSAQSTQATFSGGYGWSDPRQGLADLNFYYEQVSQKYPIDPQRVVIGGFCVGGGMAIHAALKGDLPVQGFLAVVPLWSRPDQLVSERKDIRGYFVAGEESVLLSATRSIQDVLRRDGFQLEEEIHPDLGTEFPADFGASFERAIDFIFRSQHGNHDAA